MKENTLEQILNEIIQLAEASNIEMDEIDKKYDPDSLGINLSDRDYFDAPRPRTKQLEEFLRKLTQERLDFVATIMYGGRDYLTQKEKTPFEKVLANIKGDEHLDISISEKKPLPDYLRAGMKLYKNAIASLR